MNERAPFWQALAVQLALLAPITGLIRAWEDDSVWPFFTQSTLGWIVAYGIWSIAEDKRRAKT